MFFKKYSDVFGKPGEGVHSYRLFDVAIVDAFLTILVAVGISYYYNTDLWFALVVLFILGIVFHWLFGVNTTINKKIFGEL